jgi:hypothetical protein
MSLTKIVKNAKNILDKMDNGKKYPTGYVANRLEACASLNPGDQLVANMHDVIKKIASKQSMISQKEIGDLYNKFYGFSNGDSAFRIELSQFLPDNFNHIKKASYADNSERVSQDNASVSTSEKTDLSRAFERVFELNQSKAFSTQNKSLHKKAINFVELELKSLGIEPHSVQVSTENDHYILCTAQFKNNDFTTSSLNIPVQVSNGLATLPKSFISNGEVVPLTKSAALSEIKSQSIVKKANNQFDYEERRLSHNIDMPKIALDENLKDMVDFETILIEAASGLSKSLINKASNMISKEIMSFGIPQPRIKFASAGSNKAIFLTKVATSAGTEDIFVPVDIVGERVTLPSEFYKSEDKSYDFSSEGFMQFARDARLSFDKNASFFREADEMRRLSYQQLMERVAAGVETGDYRISEDAIAVVGDKFPAKLASAMEGFQAMIKVASRKDDNAMVKQAVKNGVLIKRSNSIELFCPKLGLPLSKIDFDKNGNPTPKHRTKSAQMETYGEINPITSKILVN